MFETDGAEAHGDRLATWIAATMSGEELWTSTRPPNSRTSSHRQAVSSLEWNYSNKIEISQRRHLPHWYAVPHTVGRLT